MGRACQIVYRYNADDSKNDVVRDMVGEEVIPQKGQLIQRKGGTWRVVMVSTQTSSDGSVPVHFVSLTDKL
jgi:hypothetical protein